MPDFNPEDKPAFARRFLIFVCSVFLLAAVGNGGWRLYRKWEPARLIKQARVFLTKGDETNAVLSLRRALNINPNDIASARLAAEIKENHGDPGAVGWRKHLADLQPGSAVAAIDCAETALRFEEPGTAGDVLGRLPPAAQTSPRYHEVAGRTAAALNKPDLAVNHFRKALASDPQNESYQMNYSAALLQRGWLEDREAARATLKKLTSTPEHRVPSLRALAMDSIANHDTDTASGLLRELIRQQGSSFSDRLALIDLLHRARSPELPPLLAESKASARGQTAHLAQLVLWMNRNDRALEANEWSAEFSKEEWSDPKVCAAVAVCRLTAKDWPGLETLTNRGGWQQLEYVRFALLARALREQGRDLDSKAKWSAALSAAGTLTGTTAALARLIGDWGWEEEFDTALREAVTDSKPDEWAFRTLMDRLTRKKDTRGLWELTKRVVAANPANDAAANNFAMYSLLLGRDVPGAWQLARKLYEAHPGEAKYASTYAFALHAAGQPDQAVTLMESLTPDQLESPDVAAYYGIILASTPGRARAAKFLDLGEKSPGLLPEEVELVRQARQKLK